MGDKGDSRKKIIDAASRLFQLQGYHATGINQIIRESGAPKGSLYYYFPDGKEQLAVEAVRYTQECGRLKLKKTLDSVSDPVEAIRAVILEISRMLDKVDQLKGVPIGLIALETGLISEPLRKACRATYDDRQDIFAEKLVQHGLDPDRAKKLGLVITSMIEGAFTLAIVRKDRESFAAIAEQIPVLLKNRDFR